MSETKPQWNGYMSIRRASLLCKRYRDGLNDAENKELKQLEEKLMAYRQKYCPLPTPKDNP